MKHFLAGTLALALAASVPEAWAQNGRQSVEALYERGAVEAGPNWRGLGKTYAAAVFVHHDLRKSEGGYLAIWTAHELPAPGYFEKEKAYLSTRERVVIDCKSLRIGITTTVYYANHFGKGEVVAVSRTGNPEMTDIVPDSLEDQLVRSACVTKPRAKAVHKAKAPTKKNAEKSEKPALPAPAATSANSSKPVTGEKPPSSAK